MARRKPVEEPQESQERWLVSYADFITLLFAFFVVMYSLSSVNLGKYKILSESLDDAFSKEIEAAQSVKKTQNDSIMEMDDKPNTIAPLELDYFITAEEQQKSAAISEEILQERRRLKQVAEEFEEVLEPYIDQQLVSVKKHDLWVELEMKSNMLFSSGEADLSLKSRPVIRTISNIIKTTDNTVHVEGHTDNIPIDTVEFPSNWDLSSARASSVVRQLVVNGIDPARLAAVGYGEFHPVADNSLEQGRFKNRRVVMVLLSQALSRHQVAGRGDGIQLGATGPVAVNAAQQP